MDDEKDHEQEVPMVEKLEGIASTTSHPVEEPLHHDSEDNDNGDEHEVEVEGTNAMAEPLIPPPPQLPQTALSFLMMSGRRRTMLFDPGTAIVRVKELVWDAWPTSEWTEERPPAPSYLRIIYLGRILQDDDTLTQIGFPSAPPPSSGQPTKQCTIVHLSIRLTAPGTNTTGDEDQLKKKIRARARRALSGSAAPPAQAQGGNGVNANSPGANANGQRGRMRGGSAADAGGGAAGAGENVDGGCCGGCVIC